MTKLENAVIELDEQYAQRFPKKTIKELNDIKTNLKIAAFEIEIARLEQIVSDKKQQKIRFQMDLSCLNYGNCYFYVSQCNELNSKIQSGFTAIDEVLFDVLSTGITVSNQFNKPSIGYFCYYVQSNGMIVLKEFSPDSGD